MEWTETRIYKNFEDVAYRMAIYKKGGDEVCSKKMMGADPAGQKDFRLIAAAPDLLEALQHLCKTVRPYIMSLKVRRGFSEKVALTEAEKAIVKTKC